MRFFTFFQKKLIKVLNLKNCHYICSANQKQLTKIVCIIVMLVRNKAQVSSIYYLLAVLVGCFPKSGRTLKSYLIDCNNHKNK